MPHTQQLVRRSSPWRSHYGVRSRLNLLDVMSNPRNDMIARWATWPIIAQSNWPRLKPRASATPWYSGVARTTYSSHVGYCEIGKKVPEKRNMGRIASMTRSKSCQLRRYVHAAMPAHANARDVRIAVGRHSSAHGDWVSPSAHMHTRKLVEYSAPRVTHHESSPSAMSSTLSGVAMTGS